jgi:hypothetical protein
VRRFVYRFEFRIVEFHPVPAGLWYRWVSRVVRYSPRDEVGDKEPTLGDPGIRVYKFRIPLDRYPTHYWIFDRDGGVISIGQMPVLAPNQRVIKLVLNASNSN